MEIAGKKHIALYLTDWQMRLVKDLLGIDTHVWLVPVESAVVLRYMTLTARSVPSKVKRMYFTEWQRKEIKDTTGEDCEFVELTGEPVMKYKAPPRLAKR